MGKLDLPGNHLRNQPSCLRIGRGKDDFQLRIFKIQNYFLIEDYVEFFFDCWGLIVLTFRSEPTDQPTNRAMKKKCSSKLSEHIWLNKFNCANI
jgi:hypothetical protein